MQMRHIQSGARLQAMAPKRARPSLSCRIGTSQSVLHALFQLGPRPTRKAPKDLDAPPRPLLPAVRAARYGVMARRGRAGRARISRYGHTVSAVDQACARVPWGRRSARRCVQTGVSLFAWPAQPAAAIGVL